MNRLFRWCLLVTAVTVPMNLSAQPPAVDAPARTFPAYKCRYTLPGPDWNWSDEQAPNRIFLAGDTNGFVVTASYVAIAKPEPLNGQYIKGYEEAMYRPGQLKKRAGRFITFLGLPSYQTEGTLADGRTTATRVIMAHGYTYNLSVIGNSKPVEADPSFESILKGFDFTVPPEQGPPPTGQQEPTPLTSDRSGLNVSRLMGSVAAFCLLAAGVAVVIKTLMGKKKPVKRPPQRD